jgi:serine/threonine-protein kinase RsbT
MSETTIKTTERVIVNDDMDVIVARLRAREVARGIGFATVDQARISLAAGELARVLAQNMDGPGEIVISGINTPGQVGVQVISIESKTPSPSPEPSDDAAQDDGRMDGLAKAIDLVDEGSVEDQGEQGTRVTLMKWLT